jgi:hypothetical protein
MVLPAIYRQAGSLRKPAVLMRSVNGSYWRLGETFQALLPLALAGDAR